MIRLHALVVRSPDPDAAAAFWGGLLGWERTAEWILTSPGMPFALAFETADQPVALPNQTHLHLSSNDQTQAETVARAWALGATAIDVGQRPEEGHIVLADPDGNPFCIIEDGNAWLAGTPLLGELAGDGTRDVGLFWRDALGWPLVHDEHGETAIQHPDGGPKVAWGGGPLDERRGRNRMYFDLVTDDLDGDVTRLCSLGAAVVRRSAWVEMTDPDGNEFRLGAATPDRDH